VFINEFQGSKITQCHSNSSVQSEAETYPSSSKHPFVDHSSTTGACKQPTSVVERWSQLESQRQLGHANAKNYFNLLVEITESKNPNFKVNGFAAVEFVHLAMHIV
jgi:hypothetical protein